MFTPQGAEAGSGTFVFREDGVLHTGGMSARYRLDEGRLFLSFWGQEDVYRVERLTAGMLAFRYADGSRFSCQRVPDSGAGPVSGETEGGAGPADGGPSLSVVGSWYCELSAGGAGSAPGTVVFGDDGTVTVDGRRMPYRLTGRELVLGESSESLTYRVQTLTRSRLLAVAPGGVRASCVRVEAVQAANRYLYGDFCSFSGSVSAYSGTYSQTRVLTFDGRGGWRMTSSTYSSGGAGTFYSAPGVVGRGTYLVFGDTVHMVDAEGNDTEAHVRFREGTGEITRVVISGALYAKEVCE